MDQESMIFQFKIFIDVMNGKGNLSFLKQQMLTLMEDAGQLRVPVAHMAPIFSTSASLLILRTRTC